MTSTLTVPGWWRGADSVPVIRERLQNDVTWALGTADELGIPAQARGDLVRRARLVEERLADPLLYLAVLGEFNSGKSAFVNGLLRASLMPVAPVVTTGVAIDIIMGEHTRVAAQFTDEDVWRSFPAEVGEPPLLNRLALPGIQATMPEVLRAVCTDHTVTQLIGRVRLTHPAPLLARDVVLIDTPGFNSTTPGHAAIAQRAAAERADMAVLLIPSYSPVSMTLAEFLTGPLAQHLDRCVFVVTKLAQVDVDERDDLLRHIARRLADHGVPEPVVLPETTATTSADAETGSELFCFPDLEDALYRLTEAGRVRAIAATAERLVANVLQTASDSVREHGERLALAKRSLANVRLRDFDDFLDSWRRAVMDHLDLRLYEHRMAVRQQRVEHARTAIAQITSKISAAGTLQAVQEVAQNTAKTMTRTSLEGWLREFSVSLNAYEELVSHAVAELIAEFDREYRQLAGLAGKPVDRKIDLPRLYGPPPRSPEAEFSAAATAAQAFVSEENWQITGVAAGGATAGALIGSMLAPGIGTAVGAALGALIGGAAGSGSPSRLARARTEVTRAVEDGVTRTFAATEERLESHLHLLRAAEQAHVQGAAQALAAAAGAPVRQLLLAERRQRDTLHRKAAEADRIQREATRRLARLQHDRILAAPPGASKTSTMRPCLGP